MSVVPPSGAEPEAIGDLHTSTRSVLEDAVAVTHELRLQLHDQIELFVLETERAVHALTTTIAASIAIGVLGVFTWLGLIGTMVLLLISAGVTPAMAMLAATALNLVAIVISYRFVRLTRRILRFPATLGALKPTRGLEADDAR